MNWFETLDNMLAEKLPQLRILRDEPMSRHTSFAVGGPAKRMALPDSAQQLVKLLDVPMTSGFSPVV